MKLDQKPYVNQNLACVQKEIGVVRTQANQIYTGWLKALKMLNSTMLKVPE